MNKRVLLIAVAMIVAGGILMLAGSAGGASHALFYVDGRFTPAESFASERIDEAVSLPSFSKINIDTSYTNIEFVKSTDYKADLSYHSSRKLTAEVRGDTLYVKTNSFISFIGFSLFGESSNNTLKIYAPELSFESLRYDGRYCNLNLTADSIGSLDLDARYGSIELNNLLADKISYNASYCDFVANEVTAKKLNADTRYGKTTFYGDIESLTHTSTYTKNGYIGAIGNIEISSSYGSVTVETTNSISDYNELNSSNSYGGVHLNGDKLDKKTRSTPSATGAYRININSTYTDINIQTE